MNSSKAVVTAPILKTQSKSQRREMSRHDFSQQFDYYIGVSQHIAELKDFIIARSTIFHPTLLVGERGLRQEQIARAMHEGGDHNDQPFLAIDARALNEDALHQLLFGARGMIENMRAGTIYINDLKGLPQLLRQRFAAYIEEQNWGARSGRKILQRLVFATENDSPTRAADDRLDYGLIDQLRSSSFLLKPLRERSEDIPLLAKRLVSRIARRQGKAECGITPEAMQMLVEYKWEQNIDELEAVLESIIVNAPPPRIDESLLPDRIRYAILRDIPEIGIDLPRVVDDYERTFIETAMRQTSGSQTKAAQLLGLRVQTLNFKLKRYAELNKPIVFHRGRKDSESPASGK